MLKNLIVIALVSSLSLSAIGCTKMGEATGRAVKEVKEMPGEFKEGYHKGRNSEDDTN